MSIRASSAKQIAALIAKLESGNSAKQDAAVARLTVIGSRAVERLIALAQSEAHPSARAAAFRTLEAIGDQRALEPALRAVNESNAIIAAAAASVAGTFTRSAKGAAAVEGLAVIALDRTRPEGLRLTAVRALSDLDPSTIAPLLKSLADDPNRSIRAEAARARGSAPADDPAAALARLAERGLPDDAAEVRQLIARGGDETPLPSLLRIVERVRAQELAGGTPRQVEWIAARAAAHLALARRGSRLALYDLRESLEAAAEPLPLDMLAALSHVGDRSCLEPLAEAWARSKVKWWRDQLLEAFQAIARREHLTSRHAAIKRIQKRWPKLLSKP